MRPKVSVVLVTGNSRATIETCLAGILPALLPGDQLIIVDNESTDGTKEYLRQLQIMEPAVEIIFLGNEIAYPRAANAGIAIATNDYIVLLSPRTIVPENWLTSLQKHFTGKAVAAVGPLTNTAGKQQLERYVAAETLPEYIDFTALTALVRDRNEGRAVPAELLDLFCLMLSRQVLQDSGPLEETLAGGFYGQELAWRLKLNGHQLLIATDVFVFQQETDPDDIPRENAVFLRQHSANVFAHQLARHYYPEKCPPPETLEDTDRFQPALPFTSIVIPCFNAIEYTTACVQSILAHTREPFELIFVDNGSTDDTGPYLQNFAQDRDDVTVITNPQNRGFGSACNQGISRARGQYVLILNNDTEVTAGWLARLAAVGESFPEAGIIAPRTNNAAGPQTVTAVPYYNRPTLAKFARKLAITQAAQGFETDLVIGFCLLVKQAVIKRIGGFDPRFGAGNWEDLDFCLRARIAGYKIRVCNDVFIHHAGSRTFAENQLNAAALLAENWEKFKAKWGILPATPLQQGFDPARLIDQPYEQSRHYCPPEPDGEANNKQ
ncbi:MAG: glycosyltransferase [Heliobacteriaceae bacterium]|nr:glycosyltransferase [Heliobacteriaceae bacterium]MDD4587585.1 glycosyltransferase [Heliobacteriaceae bacterium]